VAARCRKLGIACLQGCDRKLQQLQKLASERGLQAAQVAYIGNDINDLECLSWAGKAIAVADATVSLHVVADMVTDNPGGYGAVREVCNHILAQRGRGAGVS
jgi:YrbI family 3-deoxy-D-manno-octulosonate 8-phosphate phosphatase